MTRHILADGAGEVECPGNSGRWCRLCELLDPAHPDHIPAFLSLYLAGPGAEAATAPAATPLSESLRLLAGMRSCPHWTAATDCGCGLNRCALGRGRAGVVSHADCRGCPDNPANQ